MKNTDLRIGNIIQYNDGDICRVIGISEFGLDVEFKEETTYIEHEHFSGIPITEEILLKCGFTVYDIKYRYFSHKEVPGILQLFDGVAEYSIDSNEVCWVNGLHQLQNLFHSIIGKEMVVNI